MGSSGSQLAIWLSMLPCWKAARATSGTASMFSGVKGGALTYGEPLLPAANACATPMLEDEPPPPLEGWLVLSDKRVSRAT